MAEPAAGRLSALESHSRDVHLERAEHYWSALVERFDAAAAAAGRVERDIRVGELRMRLCFAGPELEQALFPSLAHLEDAGGSTERTVLLFDSASTGAAPPPRVWGQADVGPLGELTWLTGGPLRGLADEGYGGLQVYDSRSSTLVYHSPSEGAVPWYERAAPLRAGLHWLLAGPGRHLVHAAAVGEAGRGVLLAGAGGSGKSTLAMACLEEGLEFVGDDYAVVTTDGEPRAHSIYCAPKLDAGSLARLPADVRAIVNPGFADGEKAVLRLDPGRMTRSLPISAVILPRVTGASPPVLRRASGAEALLALGPSSTFQLPGQDSAILATTAAIARGVPAWWLELGEDLHANVGGVRRVLSGGGRRMTALEGLRVLVLDQQPPTPARDSGSLRIVGLLEALSEVGAEATFGYVGRARGWEVDPPCARALAGDLEIRAELERGGFGAVVLSRPEVASEWIDAVRLAVPGALLAYDTVDLHFLREFRGAKLSGNAVRLRKAVGLRQQELGLVRAADVTLVVSWPERRLLEHECPGARVRVVSNIHPVGPLGRPFGERSGYLFVGSFGHPPNIDAVEFLLAEVWPLVRERDGAAELTIVGGGAPAALREQAGPGVTFAGHVPDLLPALGAAMAMVAPLRFGAGVKGKVLLAMAHGLPVVGTRSALEGIDDGDDHALVADDAQGLAAAMVRLDADGALWEQLRDRGLRLVADRFSPAAAQAALVEALAPALEGARA